MDTNIIKFRSAVKRARQAKALEDRVVLRERLKVAEKRVQVLEGVLQRANRG